MESLSVATTLNATHATLNVSFILNSYQLPTTTNSSVVVCCWLNISSATLPYSIPLLEQNVTITLPSSPSTGGGGGGGEAQKAGEEQRRVIFSSTEYPSLVIPLSKGGGGSAGGDSSPSSHFLWWPWQMGSQPLHVATAGISTPPTKKKDVHLHLHHRRHHRVVQLLNTTFGIRQITKAFKNNKKNAAQFSINNKAILIRGGGWSPDIFLRNNVTKLRHQMAMVLDLGLNAIRLEGKMESFEFFQLADQLGILILPGWCCCDAWQHWSAWGPEQYFVARESLRSQVRRLAQHPSVIVFIASSDELPPERVEKMYLKVFQEELWPNPTLSSASAATSPITGPSGVKMSGPYAWVPPLYWSQDSSQGFADYGGGWGFLTEGGPGASPMTYHSWIRTVGSKYVWNSSDVSPQMSHMWSYYCAYPSAHNLKWFNPPLEARYGTYYYSGPSLLNGQTQNLDDHLAARRYLYKSQAAAYEGIRAMFEGYTRNKNQDATGVIQWMLNNARPSHFWHLYDSYLSAGGGYFGAKKACTYPVHVLLSYEDGTVSVVNSAYTALDQPIEISLDAMTPDGNVFYTRNATLSYLGANGVVNISGLQLPYLAGVPLPLALNTTYFVRLSWWEKKKGGNRNSSNPTATDATTIGRGPSTLITKSNHENKERHHHHRKKSDDHYQSGVGEKKTNWYWLSTQMDILNWTDSNFFRTGCTQWADFRSLQRLLRPVTLRVEVSTTTTKASSSSHKNGGGGGDISFSLSITNQLQEGGKNSSNQSVAFFISLRLLNASTGMQEVTPTFYSENYFSLAPGENSGPIRIRAPPSIRRGGGNNNTLSGLRAQTHVIEPHQYSSSSGGGGIVPLLLGGGEEGELSLQVEVWNNLMLL